MKTIKDFAKWRDLIRKITNAQIILDRLKEALKKGRKNINRLRDERKDLELKSEDNEDE